MLNLDKYRSVLNKRLLSLATRTIASVQHGHAKTTITPNPKPNPVKLNITTRQMRQLNREFTAVIRLFERSCGTGIINTNILVRGLHTSGPPKFNPNNGDKEKGDSKRGDDKKKKENDEKMTSVFTKAVLWIVTIYMFIAFASLVIPKKNYPEQTTRYVSWKDFVHHMLAAGEVKELIIRPDMEMVTIVLQDGAIVKGRRIESTVYQMAVADTVRFEDKLREAERRVNFLLIF